jgi:iron complex transport system ATP-binding protein
VLTADNLRVAYDADARIGCNPATGRPMLLTVQSLRQRNAANCPRRVHVICGGGTGVAVLGPLHRAGFHVTAGVLNRLDSDETTCRALGIAAAVEAPFSPIGSEARAACAELIADAETLVITEVPLGKGNLSNLELALDAQAKGASVVLLGDADFAKRDYAEGAGVKLLHLLAAGGARRFKSLDEWMAASARVY